MTGLRTLKTTFDLRWLSTSRHPASGQSANEPGRDHPLQCLSSCSAHAPCEHRGRHPAVGAQAWQCCRHLRVVKMPSTVVRIEENAFRGCHLLNSITVPGCMEFGYKAFLCSGSTPMEEGPTTLEVQPNLDTVPFCRLHQFGYLRPPRGRPQPRTA